MAFINLPWLGDPSIHVVGSNVNGSSTEGSFDSASSGITGGYGGNSLTLKILIAFFCGLAMYNTLELNILIFVTFKRYTGLYFWSLLVAAWGVIPYNIGFLIKFFRVGAPQDGSSNSMAWVAIFLVTIGWWPMVTGQSVVLWSRLHLITRNNRLLKGLLALVIVDAIILHVPTTVLTFGSNALSNPNLDHYVRGYNIMEKIQMTLFTVQETLISAVYVRETLRLLNLSLQDGARRTMFQLLSINVLIIVMDLGLLACEYANLYIIETTLKGVVYSLKFKLEFAVLGKLVSFVTSGGANVRRPSGPYAEKTRHHSFSNHHIQIPDFVDPTRTPSDVTHALPSEKRNGSSFSGASTKAPTKVGSGCSSATTAISPVSLHPSTQERNEKMSQDREMRDFEMSLKRFRHVEDMELYESEGEGVGTFDRSGAV